MVAAKVEEVRIPLQGEAHMLQKAEKARAERAPVEVARVARPEAAQKVHPTSPSRANANEQTGGSDTTTPRGSNGFYDGGASTAYRAGAISPSAYDPSSLGHSFFGGLCIMALTVHTITSSTIPFPPRRIILPTTRPIPFCACVRSTINVVAIIRIRRSRRQIIRMQWSMGQSMRLLMGR
jgi:hypothetical protein